MTTTVLLIRHGQTDSNINGYYMGWAQEDLNETGYEQAQLLAKRLASTPIEAIYTSPLKRARTTAEIVDKPHHLELIEMDDLIEINLGDWQGLHAREIYRKWPCMWKQSRIDPSSLAWPNGESFAQTAQRGVEAFNSIVEASQDKMVAVVTHDIIVRVIVAHVLAVTNSIYRRLEIGNVSITKIVNIDNKSQLITLNDVSHLSYK